MRMLLKYLWYLGLCSMDSRTLGLSCMTTSRLLYSSSAAEGCGGLFMSRGVRT